MYVFRWLGRERDVILGVSTVHDLRVSLKPGHGGVCQVSVGHELVFDTAANGTDSALATIVDLVDNRVSAEP